MDKDKNLLDNEQLFKILFENTDEKDEKLYKNDLFTPISEEDESPNSNRQKNPNEIIRDKILKKLSLEDYMLFPPKNDSILITDNDLGKDKEEPEKLFEDEIDHLRNLHRLNYLTFSPFGISFFPNLNSISQDNEEQNKNICNDLKDDPDERENKILNIIDFDYNNYEINNDLLFNISMGFIDINKLKHENVVSNENFIPRSERFANGRQLKNLKNNIEIKPKIENINKKSINDIYNQDVEFKIDLMNKLINFVKDHENIEFYSITINNFYKELNLMNNIRKNVEKNKILIKWEKIFIERQKLYQKYLVDQQQKERKKRKDERKRKNYEKHIEEQKMYEIQKERKFEQELEKIRQKGLKHYDKNRKSFVSLIDFKKDLTNDKLNFRGSDTSQYAKSLFSLRSNSSCSLNNKYYNKDSSKIIFKNNTKDRKSVDYNDERYGYQKSNNDYYFKLI